VREVDRAGQVPVLVCLRASGIDEDESISCRGHIRDIGLDLETASEVLQCHVRVHASQDLLRAEHPPVSEKTPDDTIRTWLTG
jgi:hypothetical protein